MGPVLALIGLPATIAGATGSVTIFGISAGLVASVALTAGSFAVSRALAPNIGPQTSAAIPPEAKGNFRQSAPAQRVIYGRQRVGGPLFFLDDTHPPFLYWGILLSARPVSQFRTVTVGGNVVTFDESGAALTTAYVGKLWASFRSGAADQAIDPLLAANLPDLPATFRQRGHATAVFKADFGTDGDEHAALWGANTIIPNALIELDGAPVYDPWDPTQSPTDPDSWTFSQNAVRIIVDFLMADYGGRVPADRFDWDKVRTAVQHADSLVGTASGSLQKRWQIDGVISKDQSPIDVMEGMLLCSRSFIGWTQGKVWVQSSQKRLPVMTIHDKIIVGGFEYNSARPRKSVLNKVRTRFAPPDRDYQTIDGPTLVREDLETEDQELLEATIDLPFATRHQQAQRLAKATLDESRLGPSLSVTCTLDALKLEAGDIVKVWSRLFPSINGIYMVEEQGFAEDFSTIALTLAAYDGDIDGDWHPETDEQEFVVENIEV